MPPPPPPPPPELSDDVLGEAFLRLPPDDPACLLRASLTCKRWRRVLADPAFRRRHRELHRTPSIVGFLRMGDARYYASRFLVPFNPASGRPAARELPGWLELDCRHGRALFRAPSPSLGTEVNYDLVVWDPLTNEQRCLPRPSLPLTYFNAAVLCAAVAERCEHRECHGGPFRVALVWSHRRADPPSILTSACVYSSETGNWSEPISIQHPNYSWTLDMMAGASTLVGDTLYFYSRIDGRALEYQLGVQHLSIINGPPVDPSYPSWAVSLMSMEDGRLGAMNMEKDVASPQLQLWSKEAASDSDGVARWTRWTKGNVIDIEKLLPDGALPSPSWSSDDSDPLTWCLSIRLHGSVEGTDVIFVGTCVRNHTAEYMVQLNSGRARKIFDRSGLVVPYTSFCIPVTDTSSATEGAGDDASCA